MKLLLDTHALLWWQDDDARLGQAARASMMDEAVRVLVSDASFWEIAIKTRAGKLRVDLGALDRAMRADGFERLPIARAHFDRLLTLPAHHRDPFDQLLVAQAIEEDATLVSADVAIARYPVRTMPC